MIVEAEVIINSSSNEIGGLNAKQVKTLGAKPVTGPVTVTRWFGIRTQYDPLSRSLMVSYLGAVHFRGL
jgi:hypothetical protein